MKSNLVRFLSVLSLVLVVALVAGSPARAQAVFTGTYMIPGTGETGGATITIDPSVPEMTISCAAPDTLFFEFCPFTITLPGTAVAGETEYTGPLPPPAATGVITIMIYDTGDISASAVDIPGWSPPSTFFTGIGTIDDPTLVASMNEISINFTADPGQMIPPPNDVGSLTASVQTPLPPPMPTLPWPLLILLATLLVVIGVRWNSLRGVRAA